MSGATIDRKIAKGFAKVGKKLGYTCQVYRPDNYINPLADRNLLRSVPISWTEDKAFEKNPEAVLVPFIVYCDYTVLQAGDFLVNGALQKTLVVTEVNPIRGAVGYQVQDRIDVLRTVYTPTADKKTSFEEVITDLPAAVEYKSAAAVDGALTTVTSSMKSGQSTIEAWTWVTPGLVKLSDVLVLNDVRYQVTSVNTTSKGTKIQALASKAGT